MIIIRNGKQFFFKLKRLNIFCNYKQFILIIIIFCLLKTFIKENKIDIIKIKHNFNKYRKFHNISFNQNYLNQYYHDNVNYLGKKLTYGISVALCVIAKQENLYIKEFVEYYKNLGIKKIFLYDNNDIDGETFNELLMNEVVQNFIEIIDYRGMNSPQIQAYNNCYINNRNTFDWIAFYDVDEFLYLKNFSNINEFLSLSKFKKCSSILINWRYYGDNDKIYYEPKPLRIRFTKPFEFSKTKKYDIYFYSASKSIIRGNLNITWAHFPHFINSSSICNPNGSIFNNPFSTPQYSIAHIKHYSTKSTEEYLIKLFKGNVFMSNFLNIGYLNFWINKYYFLFNKKTKKKLLFIKRIIKIKIPK